MAPKAKSAGPPSAPAWLPSADMLQDLCSRFVLNCPAEELQSFDRILFLVEQARAMVHTTAQA
jgi:mRNA-decapping enzyme subunit 2